MAEERNTRFLFWKIWKGIMGVKDKNISAIVIAKNEQNKIGDCLESIVWCDEIILVDNDSVDETVDIAKDHKARIFEYKGGNYSDLRNEGLKHAKGKWILYVDADERITPLLRNEILSLITDHQSPINIYSTYAIPRKNIVLGKELKHGGFGESDYVKRLFKRKNLKKWTGDLHEEPNFIHKGIVTTGKPQELGFLKNKMIHIKAQTLEEMVEKTNKWSEVEARLMFEAKHPPMNIPRFLSAIGREFWFRMIKHKAFLDGSIGIIHGMYQVFSRFISYSKLWEMQLKGDKS